MKNYFIALCILLLAGCTEADVESISYQKINSQKFRAGFAEEDTRTFVDEKVRLLWTEGDLLTIFNNSTLNRKYEFDGETGDNSGTFTEIPTQQYGTGNNISTNYAVYPYASSNKISNDEVIKLSLPATQKYAEDSFGQDANTMVAVTTGVDDLFLPFKNIGGFLRLQLYGKDVTVKSIELRGNNEEKIAGKATVIAKYGKNPELAMSDSATESITLDCGDGVALGATAAEAKDFWIVVPPTTFTKGFTITITDTEGGTMEKSTSKSYIVERNVLKSMTAFEVKTELTTPPDNEIWYVTNLGKDGYVYAFDPIAFDANIVEQVYEKGKWVIRFDKELKSIEWPSLTNIGGTITELYLPNSLEHLGNMAAPLEIKEFYVPKNLKSIFMPEVLFGDKLERFYGDKVSEDGRCIVMDNKLLAFAPAGLKEYTIPEGITTIGQQAVRSNELKTITIPEGVSILEHEAFMPCPNIEYINLPSSLTEIGGYAFFQLKNLKKISGNSKFISDDGYSLIIDNYFQGKTFLTNFASGADITSYEIPEGVNGIESYAFYKAESLKELSFPSTLTDIASENSFWGTYNIEKIYGPNVLDDNRSLVVDGTLLYVAPKGLVEYTTPKGATKISFGGLAQKPELESIVISDDVLAVGDALSCRPYEIPVGYILWNNPNLKTVTISANIKILGMDPFGTGGGSKREASLNIETVYLRAPIPPVIGHNFPDEIPSLFPNLTIYVPEQSLEAYLGSPDWAPYRGYIKGYNYTDLPENDTYISSDYSKDGVVTTLQTATKGEGIDIVLMGDAYSDRQIADGSYKADMENLYNNLFTEEPYKSFKDHFNVYYVNVVSATEGYEYGNTALDGYFGDGTLVGGNDNAVFNYALKAISEEEMDEALIVVAMNSDNYAGTCYMYNPDNSAGYGNGVSVSYFPRGGNAETFAQLLHHEACGHGFAKLADEYAYEYNGTIPEGEVLDYMNKQKNWGWWKNVDFTSDLSQVRWKHFLNDSRYQYDGLGAYEGGLTYWTGVWRPTENSIMRHNTGGFNAPSREAIWYRIHKLAYGDSWEYDYEDFVEYDSVNRASSSAVSRRQRRLLAARHVNLPTTSLLIRL